jgi:ribosomal protein S3
MCRYKLLGGLAVRRACYGVLRFIMEQGAKGAEVIVSGKLRAQRAKSMKFVDGYMIKSGQAKTGVCMCVCVVRWLHVASVGG